MEFIIDRIEDGIAIIMYYNSQELRIKVEDLPIGIKEGDILELAINHKATQSRKKTLEKKFNSIFHPQK